jgi:hypothetical protein
MIKEYGSQDLNLGFSDYNVCLFLTSCYAHYLLVAINENQKLFSGQSDDSFPE